MLDKHEDPPSIFYTGKVYGLFGTFEQDDRSEYGRGANEFNNVLETEGKNCYIPNGNVSFLKCINTLFEKDLTKEDFESIQSYKRRTDDMTRCRIPDFCERCNLDIGIYDVKSRRILSRTVKERNTCLKIQKTTILLFGRKIEKTFWLVE